MGFISLRLFTDTDDQPPFLLWAFLVPPDGNGKMAMMVNLNC